MLDTQAFTPHITGVNRLSTATRVQILHMLCEGSAVRSVSRITGVSTTTVLKLLVDAGTACQNFHDAKVRNLHTKRVQADEIWSFCFAREKNVPKAQRGELGLGDVWTWTALDADSKLMISWTVGERSIEYGQVFMADLASRLSERVQLTTDGLPTYIDLVDRIFGMDVDYAQLVKVYSGGTHNEGSRKFALGECIGAKKEPIQGNPDPAHISTSYVEKMNQSIRMGVKRFGRLTSAHSKKFANHCHALALYFVFYNFVRVNQAVRMSPAMAAGIETRLWEMSDIVALIDAAAPKPGPRGPYKNRAAV